MTRNFPAKNNDVIELLSQLGSMRVEYPPDLLAARRKVYLGLAAQLAATGMAASGGGSEIVSVPVHEPMTMAMKVVLGALVTVIITLSTYIVTMINDNRGRLMELLSGSVTSSENSTAPDQFSTQSMTPSSAASETETVTPIYTFTPVNSNPEFTPGPSEPEPSISTPEPTNPGKHLGQTETPPGKR